SLVIALNIEDPRPSRSFPYTTLFRSPTSLISKRVALEKVSVRKAEKGTKPKLFYVGVDGDLLNPTMMEPQSTHFWSAKDRRRRRDRKSTRLNSSHVKISYAVSCLKKK